MYVLIYRDTANVNNNFSLVAVTTGDFLFPSLNFFPPIFPLNNKPLYRCFIYQSSLYKLLLTEVQLSLYKLKEGLLYSLLDIKAHVLIRKRCINLYTKITNPGNSVLRLFNISTI